MYLVVLSKNWVYLRFNCNFEPFCFLINFVLLRTEKRTYVDKGGNILNPYLLAVLLSTPCKKLPWKQQLWSDEVTAIV